MFGTHRRGQCLVDRSFIQSHEYVGALLPKIMGPAQSMIAATLLVCLLSGCWEVRASDPELTSDFAVPTGVNASTLDGNFFTSTVLRNVSAKPGNFATVTTVNVGVFPALQGLGVSNAFVQFPTGSVNPPHIHPRGTETLVVLEGELFVGLIDTTNKLFTQTLQVGDIFVFPKGLVHFQINYGPVLVKGYASFSSSNAGLVRLPNALFKSMIPDDVLAKSFGVSKNVIGKLKGATVN